MLMIWSSGPAAPGTDRSILSSCASSAASSPPMRHRIMVRNKRESTNEIAGFGAPKPQIPAISKQPETRNCDSNSVAYPFFTDDPLACASRSASTCRLSPHHCARSRQAAFMTTDRASLKMLQLFEHGKISYRRETENPVTGPIMLTTSPRFTCHFSSAFRKYRPALPSILLANALVVITGDGIDRPIPPIATAVTPVITHLNSFLL